MLSINVWEQKKARAQSAESKDKLSSVGLDEKQNVHVELGDFLHSPIILSSPCEIANTQYDHLCSPPCFLHTLRTGSSTYTLMRESLLSLQTCDYISFKCKFNPTHINSLRLFSLILWWINIVTLQSYNNFAEVWPLTVCLCECFKWWLY